MWEGNVHRDAGGRLDVGPSLTHGHSCGYNGHMSTTVGVRELKNSLSRYLRLAEGGESVVVCDHGRPVAMLTPLPAGQAPARTTAEHLAGLAARGLLTLGSGKKMRRAPRKLPKVDLSSAVIEDREDRA